MAKIKVSNATDGLLALWVEPWGTDHWMRPGEAFTVAVQAESGEAPFDLVVHSQGISVDVNVGGLDLFNVVDADGHVVPCGHQRPEDTGQA